MPACLVRGSVNIDEFYHLPHIVKPGETIASTGFERKAGGKGANQALAVARAGGAVHLDGAIGADGKWIKEDLRAGGVLVDRLRVLDNEVTGRAIIQSAQDGENSIVLHAGANYYTPSPPSEPDLDGISHLLLQNEIPLESTLAHLRAAGKKGLTTVFNPSPMLSPAQLRDFAWSDLSWLIVNEGELESLLTAFDATLKTTSQSSTIEHATQLVLALHQSSHFSPNVSIICTLGAQGILCSAVNEGVATQSSVLHLPAAPLVRPLKDTTGAGDCFAGYFVAGLMSAGQKTPLSSVLQVCLTACALCVETSGAMQSIPTREAVESRLKK